MLRQRILTALVIGPLSIACVFLLPPLEFSVFVGLVLTIAAWEWANLAGYEGHERLVYAGLMALLLALSAWLPPMVVLTVGSLWWLMALVFVFYYPDLSDWWSSRLIRTLVGVVLLVPGFVGLRELKAMPDSTFLILLLFMLIWGADVGAYFAGRAFGKAKLAPRVSPGKSWAGFYGGLITGLVIAAVMALVYGWPALMSPRGGLLLIACATVVMISVLGDLAVSMFKRYRGVKDSSGLLPGHGGFLDRIDSLLAAGPAFSLFILLFGWVPQ